MKQFVFRVFMLFVFILIITFSLKAQVNDLNNLAPQKKGDIMLSDGTKIIYKNLKTLDDTVYYETKAGVQQQIPGTDVYKITKTGNYAVSSGIACAAGGLLGGILGTSGWDEVGLGDKKTGFIVGATVVCGVVGAVVGALVKKEKVVYRNTNINFSLNSIQINELNENYFAFCIRIKLN